MTPIDSLNKDIVFELQAHSSTSTQSEPWALPTTWSLQGSPMVHVNKDGSSKEVSHSA